MNFSEVVAPVGTREFADRYAGSQWFHGVGPSDRFASILSWDELNEVLNRLRIHSGFSRLTVSGAGQVLESGTYLGSGEREHGVRLDAGRLHACLAEGNTLTIEAVDELFPTIAPLATSVERALLGRTQSRLCVTITSSQKSAPKWNDYDLLILQLDGVSEWSIYKPSKMYFLPSDAVPPILPDAAAQWAGHLDAGSCLYIPRAWWHSSRSLARPAIQLAVEVYRPRGTQLFRWLIEQLTSNEQVRTDLPHFEPPEVRARYVDSIRAALLAALNDDVVERFGRYADSQTSVPANFRLPKRSTVAPESLGPQTVVRLSGARAIAFSTDAAGMALLVIGDRRWQCSAALIPALRLLRGDEDCSMHKLLRAVDGDVRRDLKGLLLDLSAAGVVLMRSGVEDAHATTDRSQVGRRPQADQSGSGSNSGFGDHLGQREAPGFRGTPIPSSKAER